MRNLFWLSTSISIIVVFNLFSSIESLFYSWRKSTTSLLLCCSDWFIMSAMLFFNNAALFFDKHFNIFHFGNQAINLIVSHIVFIVWMDQKTYHYHLTSFWKNLLLWTYPGKFVWEAIQNYHFYYWWYKRNSHHFVACFVKLKFQLQSVTKIMRLAPLAPLFNVGCKFACSFLGTTA